jgi:cytochrome c peroxidase
MRRNTFALVTASLAAALGISSIPQAWSAEDGGTKLVPNPAPSYNPYPPGILPSDLDSEIARVERETQFIFNEALNEWRALPPPTLAGNPPILHGSGYESVEILGKLMNFDQNMSPFQNEACGFCHMPYAGFSGPIPSVNLTMIGYPGTLRYRAGKRTAQRYTYLPDFPVLEYNTTQGAFFGGNFWDGCSTGYKLQSADAEQAQHPPVDTQEMGFPDPACIAFRLSKAAYRPLFELVWGADFHIRWPGNTENICATPGRGGKDEMAGYHLFNGKANCNSCHLDGRSTTLKAGQNDTGSSADMRPLFTCFGYANEGLPLNPRVALFYQTTPDRFGFTPNPYGFGYRDLGLGVFLRGLSNPNSQWVQFAPTSDGQMQTSTARNLAMTPPQCPTTEAPGPYFQKEFFHNGYIKSLKQLVHFYNTRDVYPFNVTSGHCPEGKTEKVDCWPMPEVPNNIDMTVGTSV